MRRATLLLLVSFASTPLLAAKKASPPPPTAGPAEPTTTGYLRLYPDEDPSAILGRFVPKGEVPDDAHAITTRCSAFIIPKIVSMAGYSMDELVSASAEVAAQLKLPPFLAIAGNGAKGAYANAHYATSTKMIATIPDAAGFEACCKAAPDQCPGDYIGEVIAGTGSIERATAASSAGGIRAATPGFGAVTSIGASADASSARGWEVVRTLTQPLYFAFRTTATGFDASPVAAGDLSWIDHKPTSPDGVYFVGVSLVLTSEQAARDAAMLHARKQAVEHLATNLGGGGTWQTTWQGDDVDVTTLTTNTQWLEASAAGTVSFLNDLQWQVKVDESDPDKKKTTYQAWVLSYLPKSSYEADARALGWKAP